jgi:hypothetical protein
MPSLSKLYKSAKNTFKSNKQRKGSNDSSTTSNKSVRFSTTNESIFYTHSSLEYDRRSNITCNEDEYHNEADSLKLSTSSSVNDDGVVDLFDEEVIRNTKVNKKQGHYSIAALVSYRANI